MGLIACYQLISDNRLKELEGIYSENADETVDFIEELEEEVTDDSIIDMDKMWDVMHFVLTGFGSDDKLENSLLSEAVLGTSINEESEEYIASIPKEKIANIIKELEAFDIQKALEDFSMEKCKEAELYPDIWDYEDEEDEIKEDLKNYYYQLIDFYKKALKSSSNILVTIL